MKVGGVGCRPGEREERERDLYVDIRFDVIVSSHIDTGHYTPTVNMSREERDEASPPSVYGVAIWCT